MFGGILGEDARPSILVDGIPRDGFHVATDPEVYAVAVELDANVTITAVIPRHALPYLEIAFAERPI